MSKLRKIIDELTKEPRYQLSFEPPETILKPEKMLGHSQALIYINERKKEFDLLFEITTKLIEKCKEQYPLIEIRIEESSWQVFEIVFDKIDGNETLKDLVSNLNYPYTVYDDHFYFYDLGVELRENNYDKSSKDELKYVERKVKEIIDSSLATDILGDAQPEVIEEIKKAITKEKGPEMVKPQAYQIVPSRKKL